MTPHNNMLWLFGKGASIPARELPVPALLPPREHHGPTIFDEQTHSPFFSRIPAEIRNDIYAYAFRAGARELLSVEAHPLSFLLTCRKVHQEASTIAFREYAFPLSADSNYAFSTMMRDANLVLSSHQIQTITSFSYDLHRSYGCKKIRGYENSNVIGTAILVFPNLQRFEFRVLRGRKPFEDVHCSYDPREHEHVHAEAVRKYVPHWFHSIIAGVKKGCAYKWQAGEYWKAEWPQLEDNEYLEPVEDYDPGDNTQVAPLLSPDAVGKVRGVQKCPCRCGNVVWTSANIIQETGRMIKIDTVFYGPEDRVCTDAELEASILARLAPKTIILIEGDQPLDLAPGFSLDDNMPATSFAWDADQQYWDDLRRRNGDWKAFCKLAWQLTTYTTPREQFPGSRSRNEGDWPIMAEMAKVKNDPAARDGGGPDQDADA